MISPCGKRLELSASLKCDEPLSSFAYNFNLRCYTKAGTLLAWAGNTIHWGAGCSKEAADNPR